MHGRACPILPCSASEACSLLQIALPVGMSGMVSLVQHCVHRLLLPMRLLMGNASNLCNASQHLCNTRRN